MDHPPYLGPVIRRPGGYVVNQCALCGRSIRAPGGILVHQRGRTRPDGSHAALRLAELAWEELEALGICECGQSLLSHPPLPRPRPMGSRRAFTGYGMFNLPGSSGNG